MIKAILSLLLVFAIGCATGPQANESNSEPATKPAEPISAKSNSDVAKATSPSRDKTPAKNETGLSPAQVNLLEAQKSQNDDAINRAATAILAESPQDLSAHLALGNMYYRKQKYLAAQYFFSKALQINPKSADIFNSLGLIRVALKEPREAAKMYRKAIEIDSQNYAAVSNLGAFYIESRDFQKAIYPLEVAIQKNPKDYRNRVNYGIALAGTGKFSQAKEQYDVALKLNSSGREVIYNLAIINIEQFKKFQEGLDHLSKLRFLGVPETVRSRIIALENKAKAGLK